MNQAVRPTIVLSEAFARAGALVMHKRQLSYDQAQSYNPAPNVLYFQAEQRLDGQVGEAFDQAGACTPVYVVGQLVPKSHYPAGFEASRMLLEEPDCIKIGRHPSGQDFIVRYANAQAFPGAPINLAQVLYGTDSLALTA